MYWTLPKNRKKVNNGARFTDRGCFGQLEHFRLIPDVPLDKKMDWRVFSPVRLKNLDLFEAKRVGNVLICPPRTPPV